LDCIVVVDSAFISAGDEPHNAVLHQIYETPLRCQSKTGNRHRRCRKLKTHAVYDSLPDEDRILGLSCFDGARGLKRPTDDVVGQSPGVGVI